MELPKQASCFSVFEEDDIKMLCHAPFLPSFRPGCRVFRGQCLSSFTNRNYVRIFFIIKAVCVCARSSVSQSSYSCPAMTILAKTDATYRW